MQCGFSRDLFVQWCGNEKNTIILTNRTSPGTLARHLIDNPQEKSVTIEVSLIHVDRMIRITIDLPVLEI